MFRQLLFQHAYLVTDLHQACENWHALFGAGPFTIARHHKAESFSYRGTHLEADVSYAFGYLDTLMIQLIQQHDDKSSIYREMYAPGEEGFHHVGCLVNDFQAEKDRMEKLGFDCACELFADGVNAAYFDTRAVNGGFTEIHGDPPHIVALFAQWQRAHVNKKPGDSLFLS
jgi:hypothetical protein